MTLNRCRRPPARVGYFRLKFLDSLPINDHDQNGQRKPDPRHANCAWRKPGACVIRLLSHPFMKTVMIVDDEPGISQIVSRALRKWNYDVVTAENGLECLARMRKGFQGVILMDIAMPWLDGWQTVRALKDEQLLGESLVCMLTGLEPLVNPVGLEDAVADYLAKPFTFEALEEMVSSAFALLRP
jgi:CheY-like chemotaxis protein